MSEMGYSGYKMVVINDAKLSYVAGWSEAEEYLISQPNVEYKLYSEPLGIGAGRYTYFTYCITRFNSISFYIFEVLNTLYLFSIIMLYYSLPPPN